MFKKLEILVLLDKSKNFHAIDMKMDRSALKSSFKVLRLSFSLKLNRGSLYCLYC